MKACESFYLMERRYDIADVKWNLVYESMYSFGEGSNYFLSMRIGYLLKQKEQAGGVRKIQRQTLTEIRITNLES